MRMNGPTPVRRRKAINVSLDPRLVEEARELGVNLSRACEHGLYDVVRTERRRQWQKEHAEAIASSNAYVERHGLPRAKYRMF